MGWEVSTTFLNSKDEYEVLAKYGLCCDIPAIQVLYSIKSDGEKPKEGFFICYECFICSHKLYVSANVGHTIHQWV